MEAGIGAAVGVLAFVGALFVYKKKHERELEVVRNELTKPHDTGAPNWGTLKVPAGMSMPVNDVGFAQQVKTDNIGGNGQFHGTYDVTGQYYEYDPNEYEGYEDYSEQQYYDYNQQGYQGYEEDYEQQPSTCSFGHP